MGVGEAKRGCVGPLLNKDYGGFDRPRALFSGMPVSPSELGYVTFFDDFTQTVIDATNEWIVIADSGACVLDADAVNGVDKLLSAATTDDDGASIQRANTIFLVKSGVPLWFEASVKVSDADQCDMFVGLAENFITDPEAVWAAGCARVGFKLEDGDATLICETDNNTATTQVTAGVDMADATFKKLGFRVDGGYVRFYVNRHLVTSMAIPSAIAAITLGPCFAGLSGNATGTHYRSIDYIYVCMERQ